MTKTNLNLEMSCFQLTLNKKINVHCMQIYPFIDIINQYPKDIMDWNLQKKLKHRRSGSLLQKFGTEIRREIMSSKRKLHKWSIDFIGHGRSKSDKQVQVADIRAPVGYTENTGTITEQSSKDTDQKLIDKRSWDIALGPLKQIPMNFFIMWMAGNSISIFPIMMVGMMFFKPIQAFISVQNTFVMIEGSQAYVQKFIYIFGNFVCLALATYKCQTMGLLPTHASDWLAFMDPQKRMEWCGGGLVF
ncbi:ER membrane protein complex subunit 4-like isoform X2 [Ostrea edulis]|uniref:ER membrane protein complex subunit 4-like isoform X2 n=1 Tax=Ostrea edulis TaxID=37623 RepID=UPI0024AF407C|nr:ER membrane protein complex subunit 4-like isoform X2 [Ostrea edulis]